jgi:hypothetical protein
MIHWSADLWTASKWNGVGIGLGLFLISLVISLAAIAVVMVRIPPEYFATYYERVFLPNSSWIVRWGALVVKNVFGVLLIVLGIILSVPGIPGQGILTILLGLIMVDIPGKRPLEAHIVRRPTVLKVINRLRARYNKPALITD